MLYASITMFHMQVLALVVSDTIYIHCSLIPFIVWYAIGNVNKIQTIFSSHSAKDYCYLRIFCISWSSVVLFNRRLWYSTASVILHLSVTAVCCCIDPHVIVFQGCVCMWLFTWEKLPGVDNKSERICHSRVCFCFMDSGMLPHAGYVSALSCLPSYCSIFCQLKKYVKSPVGKRLSFKFCWIEKVKEHLISVISIAWIPVLPKMY